MRPIVLGNLLLIASMVSGVAGHALLKRFVTTLEGPFARGLLHALSNFYGLLHVALILLLITVAFVFWMASLRFITLTYAYALSSGSVVLVAWASRFFLQEQIPVRMWLGVLLIAAGIALVTTTYATSHSERCSQLPDADEGSACQS